MKRVPEAGQASLEYILMLFTAVLMFMAVFNTFLRPALSRLATYASGRMDKALMQGDLHTLPFRK